MLWVLLGICAFAVVSLAFAGKEKLDNKKAEVEREQRAAQIAKEIEKNKKDY